MAAAMRAKRCPRKSSASSTLMYRFELMGTREDVHAVREGVRRFFSDTPTD